MGGEKKGGKGPQEKTVEGEEVQEVSAWASDGDTGNEHENERVKTPEKKRRGRPPKKAEGKVGKIDSFLIKGAVGNKYTKEGFVTKSKLSYTPIKEAHSKDGRKERREAREGGIKDGISEGERSGIELGPMQSVGGDAAGGGEKEREDDSEPRLLPGAAQVPPNRVDMLRNSQKRGQVGEHQKYGEEEIDDPSEREEELTGAKLDESSDDGHSELSVRVRAESGLGNHWFVEVRKAEERLRREMKNRLEDFEKRSKQSWEKKMKEIYEESEGNMKRWYWEEINRMKQECMEVSSKMCDYCEQSSEEIRELRNKVRELKESAERERRRWEEERHRLTGIYDGKERNEGRKSENSAIRGGAREKNCSFDSISEASVVYSTGKARGGRGKLSRVEDNLRKLMERKPKPLDEWEFEEEREKRKYRKNNVSVYFPEVKGIPKDSFLDTIAKKCGQDIRGKTTKKFESGRLVVARFKDRFEKLEMMRKKKELKGTDIWIKDDLTKREKEVQKWLWEVAENEKKLGRRAEVRYMRINFGDGWWRWNEWSGSIEPQRDERKGIQYDQVAQQPFRVARGQ